MEQRQTLTESMFYVLMCFYQKPTFGIEIVATIKQWTNNRVVMGPGTLYTILGKFEEDKLIKEIDVEGRKRTYQITDFGRLIFESEVERLNDLLITAQYIKENHQ